MKKFNGFSLLIALLVFTWGRWRQGVLYLSNHCHIQISYVSHDLLNSLVSGLAFSSPPPASPI